VNENNGTLALACINVVQHCGGASVRSAGGGDGVDA
jgi:hypothetical protein